MTWSNAEPKDIAIAIAAVVAFSYFVDFSNIPIIGKLDLLDKDSF